jgi:hypothetical protein
MTNSIFAYGLILFILSYILKKLTATKHRLSLPPGPKGLPLVGNITDLPPKGVPEWQHWIKHKDLYGPISSVTVFGQTIILIHDKDIVQELLEKRSAHFSSRPQLVFGGKMYEDINSAEMRDTTNN